MGIASLGAGLGAAALGGIMTGLGQRQQGGALRSAGREARRNAEAAGRDLTQEGEFTAGRIGDLRQQSQGLRSDRTAAFGPGQAQAFQQAVPQAAQTTAAGREGLSGLIRRRGNFMNAGGGLGTALASNRLESARAAPGRNLRNLQLAHAFTQPQQQQAGLDYQTGMARLGRQGQELGADQDFRRTGILGQYGLDQQQAGYRAQDARQAGAGLSALGSFATGLAPGLAAIGARAPQPPPPGATATAPQGPLAPDYQTPNIYGMPAGFGPDPGASLYMGHGPGPVSTVSRAPWSQQNMFLGRPGGPIGVTSPQASFFGR